MSLREHDDYAEYARQSLLDDACATHGDTEPPASLMPPRAGVAPLLTRLYIAGASREYRRAKAVARSLECTGLFDLTFQWWTTAGDWYGRDGRLSRAEQSSRALLQHDAIATCDVFWLLYPKALSVGAFVELGSAMRLRLLTGSPRIVVTGARCSDTIFTADADFRDPGDLLGRYDVVRFAQLRRFAAEDSRAVVP